MKNTPVVLGRQKQGKNEDQLGFTPYNSPYRFLPCCYIPKHVCSHSAANYEDVFFDQLHDTVRGILFNN